MRPVWWLAVLALLGCDEKKVSTSAPAPVSSASATATASPPSSSGVPKFDVEKTRLFAPIPEGVEKPVLDDVTRLGQMLFFDPRLSANGKTACVTCHDFSKAGADGAVSAKGARNTPTVINAGGAFAQGWDARVSTIEELALPHAIDGSLLTAADDKKLLEVIGSIPGYAVAFKKAFPDEKAPLSGETFGRAVGTYTKKLFARARWDRYLAGDKTALKDEELSGFAMFVEAGCTSCHQGKYIGATQTQKLGMARPWPGDAGTDPGHFAVTKQEMDRGMWKVPSLRNVTRTAPYLHDGSVVSLEEMTKLMGRHQAGRELTDEQVKAIVAFFGTLEGDPPKELTTMPTLPPSGPKTPKPGD